MQCTHVRLSGDGKYVEFMNRENCFYDPSVKQFENWEPRYSFLDHVRQKTWFTPEIENELLTLFKESGIEYQKPVVTEFLES